MIINGQDVYFYYCVDPSADEPILLINKHIGFDEKEGYGIMGDVFMRELFILDSLKKKRIQVFINSPGGNVNDGYSIYMALLKTNTPVDTVAGGIVASISAVIFQGGRKRIMLDYAKLMYHMAYNPDGSKDKSLDAINDSLAIAISERTGKKVEDIKSVMKRETWLSADGEDGALALGFCDEVEKTGQMNKKYALTNLSEIKAFHVEANNVMNSIFNIKNNIPMNEDYKVEISKVNTKLGLNPEATHESRALALETILTKAKMSDDKRAEMEDKMEDMRKACTKAEKEAEDLKAKMKKMEDKIQADDEDRAKAEEKEKAKKAKDMIAGYVAEGKIKNDEKIIAAMEAKACADFDGVRMIFDEMPINKTAPKNLTIITNPAAGTASKKIGSVIASTMIEFQNKMSNRKIEVAAQ